MTSKQTSKQASKQTDKVTSSLLELLVAAKKISVSIKSKDMSNEIKLSEIIS